MFLKLVIDTSVWISHLLLPGSLPSQAIERAEKVGAILLGSALYQELERVLARPKFQRYISEQRIREFLKQLLEVTEYVEVATRLDLCRDPDDNHILALALTGGASYVVTGDADLLCLHPFQGIAIVTPRQFVELEAEGQGRDPA